MGFYHLLLLPILQDSPTLIFRIISFKVISYHFLLLPMLQDYEYLDLSSNKDLEIETESPSWVPTFQLSNLNLANCKLNKKNGHVFPSFISSQVHLYLLDLSHNSIVGSIPCQLLFNTSIELLSLRSNKIDGSLSFGCFANLTSSLIAFDMSDNNVTGSLPENIGHLLPFLSYVNMSSNALEGIIPWSFGNLYHFRTIRPF
jgi:hypothetical protein